MAIPVIMPKQGQSVETCIITRWLKNQGDFIKKGEVLFEYETDKASFEAEAETEGTLIAIFFNNGDEVPVLSSVGLIGNKDEKADIPAQFVKKEEKEQKIEITTHLKTKVSENLKERIRISPRARIMATKHGVDLSGISGSGPNGRIISKDIEIVINSKKHDESVKSTTSSNSIVHEYIDKKIPNIRKLIAKAMHNSLSNSAQLTHHMSADIRKIQTYRNNVKVLSEKGVYQNITLNDILCYCVIKALEKYPEINSHFLNDTTRTFKKIHLGLAVDTSRGLMVPVIQNADDLSLKGLSVKLFETAEQCRKGNINPELLASTSASFTVSNLGNYGVEMFTPIINLPQIAILGINTIIYRPADLGNGTIGFIPVIGLSLTYDHRAIDGGPATLFLREIKSQIENFNENI